MKAKQALFLFLLLTGSSIGLKAQNCVRVISAFVQASGGYPIYGTASIEEQPDSTLKLTLDSNFSTTVGPDLHLFLSHSNSTPASDPTAYPIAPLQSPNGYQTYIIPDSVDIMQFDYLLIHCVMGVHFWGGGMFGNCIASVQEPKPEDMLRIYPDPSYGNFSVAGAPVNSMLTVTDMMGKKVFETKTGAVEFSLDLSEFPCGIYQFNLFNEGYCCRKKVVIAR